MVVLGQGSFIRNMFVLKAAKVYCTKYNIQNSITHYTFYNSQLALMLPKIPLKGGL